MSILPRVIRTGSKRVAVTLAIALAFGTGALTMSAAHAATLPIYDEGDSPNPFNVTNGLVFYKAADLGWTPNGATGVPIADVHTLAYTVTDSTSFAPSYQLVTRSDNFSYARIVWEPYLQSPAQGPNTGAFSDLQNGLWWTNKIPNGNPPNFNPGSQANPQPLSFFQNGGGAGWTNVVVGAIAIHQGTANDSTSLVTRVNYNGDDIAIGNAQVVDNTPTDLGESAVALAGRIRHGRTARAIRLGSIGSATDLRYQWFLGRTPVAGATSETFKLPRRSKGRRVSVHVTGTFKNTTFTVDSNSRRVK